MTHWKRPWWWERLRAGEGGGRGWDGWMASPTQWTWVWATSRRWWRTGKPGVLQPMRSQKVGYDLVTEQLLRFILSQKDIKMLHRNVGFTSKIRTQLIFQGQFAELLYLFLFHYSVQFSRSVMSDSLWPYGLQHTRLPCPSQTLEAYTQKGYPFQGQKCQSKKSRDTWSNGQIWPWSTKWSRAKANKSFAKRAHWS